MICGELSSPSPRARTFRPLALKALVNHAIGGDVTEGYVQMTVERLREPAQKVCDRMIELCGIEMPQEAARMGERG